MNNAQKQAHDKGYVETILGRRRHIPDMMLDDFEFKAEPGYINPDVDPLDLSTLNNNADIPDRVKSALYRELKSYKYYGQVVKRSKELLEKDHIKVINNRHKITEASRKCVNCVDFETEIFTAQGWKKYNEIDVGEKVYSYRLHSNHIELDTVSHVHIQKGLTQAYMFQHGDTSFVCTDEHRWVVDTASGLDVVFAKDLNPDDCPLFADIFMVGTSKDGYTDADIYRGAPLRDWTITPIEVSGVWCVTTGNHTWIARRHGEVFITSNSIIQGSAADLTKMAMLKVEGDETWHQLGGQVQVPVHDELVAEVPVENAGEAGAILSRLMCEAASFMPFSIKCDVTISYHWSGIEYPCPHKKPESLSDMEDDEIRWVQYHLYDVGYYLPVYKKADGSKPEGNEALGVNGVMSDELLEFIKDYKNRYNITSDTEFIQHIEEFVATGKVPIGL